MSAHHQTDRGEIHRATAEEVYPTIDPGSVSLLISDGPYGMMKAAWDRMGIDGLPDWYAPHIEAWGLVCGASATVYLWNTAEGWARIDPLMRAAGWTFRSLITWDKGIGFMAGKCDVQGLRSWYDVTEVCGMYQREAWAPSTCAGQEIAHAAGADRRNPTPLFFRQERERAGMTKRDLARHFPSKTGGLTGCVANWEGGLNYPTWEVWQTSAAAMQSARPAKAGERPYLVLAECWRQPDHLRASYDHLRAEYDHLRAEYEASRPAFTCPIGVGNVWRHGQVSGAERLKGADGKPLHPCQKPIRFYDRIIRASSRPGELVLEPFGGTCRAAAAIEQMTPADARRYICSEPDKDGRSYLPAVVQDLKRRRRSVSLLERIERSPEQRTLFTLEPA